MAGNLRTFIAQMRYWSNLQDPGVGYDQDSRWNLKNGGSVDCSSFVIACLKIAGFHTGGATFTGNMRAELTKHGWLVKSNNGRPRAGDILLNDADHTAVYLGGGLLAQASINELGTITGGTPGNQTQQETNIRNYYNFPWDCYLRHDGPPPADPHPDSGGSGDTPAHARLKPGSTGARVRRLQEGLNRVFPLYSNLEVTGEFDAETTAVLKEFQTRAGIPVTGVIDPTTARSLHKYGVNF